MSGYLIDTNIISELRKQRRNAGVVQWFERADETDLYLSVLVLGEIRMGIERLRTKDPVAANALSHWLTLLRSRYREKILPVDEAVCDCWGELSAKQPLPAIDGLLAATALVHQMTLVTRNVDDFKRTGAKCLNPFEQ